MPAIFEQLGMFQRVESVLCAQQHIGSGGKLPDGATLPLRKVVGARDRSAREPDKDDPRSRSPITIDDSSKPLAPECGITSNLRSDFTHEKTFYSGALHL